MIQGHLTTKEAADILGLTSSRIRQMIIEGTLKGERVGGKTLLIKQSSIERYQRKKQQNGNGKRKAAW